MPKDFCSGCRKIVDIDELTQDGMCYKCSNQDIAKEIEDEEVKILLQKAIEELAKAKQITPDQLKSDLINESAINQEQLNQPAKKNNSGDN